MNLIMYWDSKQKSWFYRSESGPGERRKIPAYGPWMNSCDEFSAAEEIVRQWNPGALVFLGEKS